MISRTHFSLCPTNPGGADCHLQPLKPDGNKVVQKLGDRGRAVEFLYRVIGLGVPMPGCEVCRLQEGSVFCCDSLEHRWHHLVTAWIPVVENWKISLIWSNTFGASNGV